MDTWTIFEAVTILAIVSVILFSLKKHRASKKASEAN